LATLLVLAAFPGAQKFWPLRPIWSRSSAPQPVRPAQGDSGLFLGLFRLGRLGGNLGLARTLGLCRLAGLGTVGQDLGDPNQRKSLAVAALTAGFLTAALLEGDPLGSAALLDPLGGDGSARHGWGAERGRIATHHQHLAELDDLARLAFDLLDLQQVVGS